MCPLLRAIRQDGQDQQEGKAAANDDDANDAESDDATDVTTDDGSDVSSDVSYVGGAA